MTNDLPIRVAALKVLKEITSDGYENERVNLAGAMARGDRLTARDPRDDAKLASLTRTDPKPVVTINGPLFAAWMRRHYPALCETEVEIAAGMMHQVLRVLMEHAPELLVERTRVLPDTVTELRARALEAGVPVGPGGELDVEGIEVETPDSVVAVRLADDARQRVLDLVREGRVEIDGTIRPQIEGATDA